MEKRTWVKMRESERVPNRRLTNSSEAHRGSAQPELAAKDLEQEGTKRTARKARKGSSLLLCSLGFLLFQILGWSSFRRVQPNGEPLYNDCDCPRVRDYRDLHPGGILHDKDLPRR